MIIIIIINFKNIFDYRLALSIRSSINSWNCFLRGVGDDNFEKKAAVCVWRGSLWLFKGTGSPT